jgi:hypothetical protein
MADANQSDFLGEGTAAPAQAPAMTPEQIAETRRRKLQWLSNQGLDANGNQLPAYGTPQTQGGTATGFQVTAQPRIGTGAMAVNSTTQLGSAGAPVIGSTTYDRTYQTAGAGVTPGAPVLRSTAQGTVTPQFGGNSGALNAQTSQGTTALQEDLQRRQQGQEDALASATNSLNGSPLDNPNATNQAAQQARGALGAPPTIDQGIADRQQGGLQQALNQSQQVVDKALAPTDQTALEAATNDARSVLDRLLNGPNTAQRLGSQTLRSQLALARSAAGGPGAVQEALRNAQTAAPELEAQAAQQATAEEMQRNQAAGQITGQLQQNALGAQQNETQRISAGAQAAAGAVQGQLGTRSQDIDIAKSNQDAASKLIQNITQLTGTQLELDQRNQELLGQMARDAAAMKFNWGQLDAQTAEAEFDRWVKVYGIDQAAAAQIKAAAKANDKNAWDYIVPIVGAAATVGAAAV